MLLDNFGCLPQWSVVGDTFPLQKKLSSNFVFYDKLYHLKNKDIMKDSNNKKGFENFHFSWGHDEFLAKTLEMNNTNLPEEAIYLIRYHSFYSWHSPRNNKRGYIDVASNYDWYMLPLLKAFQKSDLYSKNKEIPKIDKIKKSFNNSFENYFGSNDIKIFYN